MCNAGSLVFPSLPSGQAPAPGGRQPAPPATSLSSQGVRPEIRKHVHFRLFNPLKDGISSLGSSDFFPPLKSITEDTTKAQRG